MMASLPAISVVVPFYNSERHIGDCLDSLQNQQGFAKPYELIFVDNGSTDASGSIVSQVPEVQLVDEEVRGAYAARNTGIRRARAPIIAFTDADCRVDRDWLKSIREVLQDPTMAIAVGVIRYPRQASPLLRLLGAYENAKIDYVLNRCEPAQHFAYTNNMAVRRSVFEEVGLFEEWPRAADTELIHRLASQRSDLRIAFSRSMRITHLEFVGARSRMARLRLYKQTNSKVESFRELTLLQRVAALGCLWHRRGSSWPG